MPSRLVLILALICSTSLTVRAQTDTPRSGEGIYSLLGRNGIEPTSTALAEFRSLNRRNLLPGDGLRSGIKYRLPNGVKATRNELFGSKYADIPHKGSELDGSVFFLISGHGGRDPGAIGKRDGHLLYEDEYAYDVTLRVARELISHGADVKVLVNDNDGIREEKFLKPDRDEKNLDGSAVSPKRRVQERVESVNRLSRQSTAQHKRVIEIHVDAREQSSAQVDVHFYYSSRQGRRLSTILRDTMKEQYLRVQPNRSYNGKVSQANLYTLKYSNPVASYIELGNIHHDRDQVRIIEPDNRQAIANWIALGLIKEAKSSSSKS